jgi:hypothetical protein
MKNTYPDPLQAWIEKVKDGYGLAFAKAIGSEWFGGNIIQDGSYFSEHRNRIRENRLYVRGEQSVDKYKKQFERQDGDLSLVNMDWRVSNHVQKFCRVVSNGIQDNGYRTDIRANDRITLNIKKEARDTHLKNMYAMPLLNQAKEKLGLDMIPKGFIPKSEEELNIYEQLNEKPKIEIAEEIIIDYIKKTNNWSYIEKEKNKDLTDNGIAGVRVYTDPTDGVKIQFLDIEYLIYNRVTRNDFKDGYYYGYVDTVTIGDIAREGGFQDNDLREIAKMYSKKYEYTSDYMTCQIEKLYGYQIDVLRFAFSTSKKEVYKKVKRNDKTVKITKKDDNYNPPERADYGKLESVKGTWMEGSYVIGTDYIFEYKESENIVRDELNKPLPPFILRATDIYEGRLHSFLDDIKAEADELTNISNKLKQLRAEIKPDIIEIDEDVLAEVDADGNKIGFYKETLNMLNIKGIIIRKRIDMGEAGIKEGNPVRMSAQPQGGGIPHLLNLYAHHYNQIRDITGINPAADGSLPHDALLGVSQMAQLAANTATSHIVDAAIDFNKRISEVISSRVHAIFRNKNAVHLQEKLIRAVGKRNVEVIEVLKDRHLHDFGFTVEMIPTQQEMQEFKEDLGLYLQQGLISPEIKSEATRIAKTSLKLASQYLAYMSKKRQEEMAQQQEQTMMMKTQSDMAAAQQASEGRIQELAIQTKMKLQYETAMSSIRVTEKQAMLQVEAPTKDVEFQQEVYLEKLKSMTKLDEFGLKEDRKDQRLDKASTHQSKLIDQRKKDIEPINFENEFSFEALTQ